MDSILKALSAIVPLPPEERQSFARIVSSVRLAKGEYWSEAGRQNRRAAFLEQGYLRKFYVKDGKEITESLYFEGDFCADIPSIVSDEPSRASIIAQEDTAISVFGYDDFISLREGSCVFERLYRVLVEAAFLRFYRRTTSFIFQTPKERYDELVASAPQIIERVPQYHIASYLGISPQHLSRLRSQDRRAKPVSRTPNKKLTKK